MNRRLLCSVLLLCLLTGCRQKMAEQPSLRPDGETSLFPDGRANRPAVPGTVARGHLRTDRHLFAGERPRAPEDWARPALALVGDGLGRLAALAAAATPDHHVESFPFPVTRAVLEHGRARYMIYCVVCHDAGGAGRGIVVRRGYTPPPSLHIDRLREAPPGHFFDVISSGYGSMPSYREQIPANDRWAIVGYIRALQLSRHYPESDLTEEMRREWREQEGRRD
jgi:mono/diheme cytochrome c family protein